MPTVAREAVTPTEGKIVYDTDEGAHYFGNGSAWVRAGSVGPTYIPMASGVALTYGASNQIIGWVNINAANFEGPVRDFWFYATAAVGGPTTGAGLTMFVCLVKAATGQIMKILTFNAAEPAYGVSVAMVAGAGATDISTSDTLYYVKTYLAGQADPADLGILLSCGVKVTL